MALTMTDGERLAVLEVGMNGIQKDVTDIKVDIKALARSIETLVSSKEADQVRIRGEIDNIATEIKDIKAKYGLWRWLSPTLSAVLASVVTFLVIQYLKTR